MAIRGMVPTKLHEIRRWWHDAQIDRQLRSAEGQASFWAALAERAAELSLVDLLRSTLHLPGDVIECGVYRGDSLLAIASAMQGVADHKTIYGLDSFHGFPHDRVTELDLGGGRGINRIRRKFRFCADTPLRLNRVFHRFQVNAQLVPGFFSETLPQFQHHYFCFVHLDCDIYASYKECLETLYDQVVPGGVIVMDEWWSAIWPGARQAVEEFFRDKPENIETCTSSPEHCFYVRKRAPAARAESTNGHAERGAPTETPCPGAGSGRKQG